MTKLKYLFALLAAASLCAQQPDVITPLNQAAAAIAIPLEASAPLQQAQTAVTAALAAANAQVTTITGLNTQVTTLTGQLATAMAAAQPTFPTGIVRYYQLANSNWDIFTSSVVPAMQATIATDLTRIATYAPYFDSKLSWMPRADVYIDSYSFQTSDPAAAANPSWILKDAAGNLLYIPFACSNGTCPQYAADISNPGFVAHRIADIAAALKPGYMGVFLDDVNLQSIFVGNGAGTPVAPIDTATGMPMTLAAWKTYFGNYLGQIRMAFPNVEIIHNSIWFAGAPTTNQAVAYQMAQADLINVERGFGDSGLTGGTGFWSLSNVMNYIDSVHAIGKAVVIEDYYLVDQTYSLACYFLIQNGHDYFGILEQTPANWPANLYRVNLGPALGSRYTSGNGLWHRDFANGFVLVNEPGAAAQTIALPAGTLDANRVPATSVTLGAKQGGIFLSK